MKTNHPSLNCAPRLLFCLLIASFQLTALNVAVADSATTLQLGFDPPSALNESNRTPVLTWNAEAEAYYQIQTSTNLVNPAAWRTVDVVSASTNGPLLVRVNPDDTWDLVAGTPHFYRLILPQPQIFDVQPRFIDSSDTNAVLYILGQLLPTNATVVISGQTFTPTVVNSNGVWAYVRLNGLPPGEPVIGTLSVVDNGTSNVVATLPVQSPILYGPTISAEQLQGPPEEPPASPEYVVKTTTKSNQSNDRLGSGESPEVNPQPASVVKTKTKSNQSNDRFSGLAEQIRENDTVDFATRQGKAGLPTPVTRTRVDSWAAIVERTTPGGGDTKDDDCDMEVDEASGEFRCSETDLAIPGRGMDFAWTRTYRSRTGPTTAQGAGWDFSYNVSLTQNGNGTITLRPGNGRADTFYQNGTNWTRDEYFCEIRDLNSDGMPDVLFADSGRWLFNPVGPGSQGGGKLSQIVDRNGNTMSLYYDFQDRCDRVVDDLGRTNVIAYNLAGQLESVTDFSGRTVRYEYDGNGDLVAAVSPAVTGTPTGNDFPGGITNRYTYSSGYPSAAENHLLLSVIDGKGQVQRQHVYQHNQTDWDFLRCVSVQSDPYPPVQLTYLPVTPTPASGFATTKVIVRDAVGNVTESFYDSRQRCVRELEYTGRAPNLFSPTTETLNRPAGKLRADDPDTYETKWTWNPDSLCALETLPDGERTRMVYERDFHSSASARKKGDCRVVRAYASSPVDTDGDGIADTSELAWHFDYDPNFGSPAKVVPKGYIVNSHSFPGMDMVRAIQGFIVNSHSIPGVELAVRKGWDGTIKGNLRGPRQTTSLDGSYSGGSAGMSAARGKKLFVGNLPYDNQGEDFVVPDGNGVAINQKGTGADKGRSAKVITDRDTGRSKGFGFVVAATDPRGIVTTGSYDAKGNRVKVRFYWDRTSSADADFAYNPQGQMTAITNAPDANGYRRVDTISYYTNGPQNGYVQSLTRDLLGHELTHVVQQSPRGQVTAIIDPRGNDALFTYNALDQLVRVQTPTNLTARCTTDFIYDANGNVVQSSTELRDENDTFLRAIVPKHVFDVLDRRTETAWQVSPGVYVTNKFFYDGNSQLTSVQSPLAVSGLDPHNTAAFEYDERGLLFREIGAPGSGDSPTNIWSYDANGFVRHTEFQGGGTGLRDSVISRDGFGRPIAFTDPMSNVVTYAYDRNDNLILARALGELNDGNGSAGNVRLSECRWKYDGLDRCVESRASFFNPATQIPIGDGLAVTTLSYAPNGDCLSVTDDNSHTTRYAYDTAGRLSSVTDPKTNVMTLSYDADDNLTGMVATERSDLVPGTTQFSRSYAYDAWGRCVRNVDNVDNTNRYTYDSLSRLRRQEDPDGRNTWWVYDDASRVTLVAADLNGDGIMDLTVDSHSTKTYDDNSRCLSSTDANTNTTYYGYDSLNRLVETANPDGTYSSLVWSPRSNLLLAQDPNGNIISNRYDLNDRCIARDITPGPGVATTTTFEQYAYDGLSRLVAATNDASHSEFEYDSLGNNQGNHVDGWQLLSAYDSVGNRTSMTYPSGRVVTYTYDALDQVKTVSSSSGGLPPVTLATYDYDGPGRVGRIARANSVNTRVTWDGLVSPPNAAGDYGWHQVSGVNHQVAGGGAVIDQRVATFDRNQNRTLRAQAVPFTVGGATLTNVFDYDALNRLHEAVAVKGTSVRDQSYQLDGNGNRQLVLSNGLAQPYFMDNTPPPGPADFQMNQYTLTPLGSQTYDENGNLIVRNPPGGAQLLYQYDYADRLVSVADLSGGFPAPVASYAYDALGQRISKTVYPGGLPPVITDFVRGPNPCKSTEVCGNGIIETRQGGLLTRVIVNLPDDMMAGDTISGSVVAYDAGGQPQFFHADDLGNMLVLTGAGGNVIERYDYDDFGQPQFLTSDGTPMATNASPAGNPFLFHGMEWDDETGFYFEKGWPCRYEGPRFDSSEHFDPQTGSFAGRGYGVNTRSDTPLGMDRARFMPNNPWSGGGGSGGSSMQKGTVKFFNETKGFGFVTGGGSGLTVKGSRVNIN